MEIHYLDETTSTHQVLIEKLQNRTLQTPIALSAQRQVAGVGSRGNSWTGLEGNLFLSFALPKHAIPVDVQVHSMSIYFSFLMKETLREMGSNLFLKWPNDFYIEDKKVGGTITKIVGENVVCSMGINLVAAPENFAIIDVNVDKNRLLESFFLKLKQDYSWKDIFRKYQVEFIHSQRFLYYDDVAQQKISLKDARLLEDGSIELNGRKVYSLR